MKNPLFEHVGGNQFKVVNEWIPPKDSGHNIDPDDPRHVDLKSPSTYGEEKYNKEAFQKTMKTIEDHTKLLRVVVDQMVQMDTGGPSDPNYPLGDKAEQLYDEVQFIIQRLNHLTWIYD